MARTFSETMSALRRARGCSQRRAAADLNISQALLSHYENGAREPGLDFVRRACAYYGVSADYLLGLSELPVGAERAMQGVAAMSAGLDALREQSRTLLEELKK